MDTPAGVTRKKPDPMDYVPELQKTMFGLNQTMIETLGILRQIDKSQESALKEEKKRSEDEKNHLSDLTDALEAMTKQTRETNKKIKRKLGKHDELWGEFVKKHEDEVNDSIERTFKEIGKVKEFFWNNKSFLTTKEGIKQLKDIHKREKDLLQIRDQRLAIKQEEKDLNDFSKELAQSERDIKKQLNEMSLEREQATYKKLKSLTSGLDDSLSTLFNATDSELQNRIKEKFGGNDKLWNQYLKSQTKQTESTIEDSYREIQKVKSAIFEDTKLLNTDEGVEKLKDLLEKETKILQIAKKQGVSLKGEEEEPGLGGMLKKGILGRMSRLYKGPMEFLMKPLAMMSGMDSGDIVDKMFTKKKKKGLKEGVGGLIGGLNDKEVKSAMLKPARGQKPSKAEILRKNNPALGAVAIVNELEKLNKNGVGGGGGGLANGKLFGDDFGVEDLVGRLNKLGPALLGVGAAVATAIAAVEAIKEQQKSKAVDTDKLAQQRSQYIALGTTQADKDKRAVDFDRATTSISSSDRSTRGAGQAMVARGAWGSSSDSYRNTAAQALLYGSTKKTASDIVDLNMSALPSVDKESIKGGIFSNEAALNYLGTVLASGQLPTFLGSTQSLISHIIANAGSKTNSLRKILDSESIVDSLLKDPSMPPEVKNLLKANKDLDIYLYNNSTPVLMTGAQRYILGQQFVSYLATKKGATDFSQLKDSPKDYGVSPVWNNSWVTGKNPQGGFTFSNGIDYNMFAESLTENASNFRFHTGTRYFNPINSNKGYTEYNAVLREGERVLNPMENKEYTRYLVDSEMSKILKETEAFAPKSSNTFEMELLRAIQNLSESIHEMKTNNSNTQVTIDKYDKMSIINSLGVSR